MNFLDTITRLARIGIDENDVDIPVKQLTTFNILNLVFVASTTLYAALFALFGLPLLAIGSLGAVVFLGVLLLLTSSGFHRLSRIAFIVGSNALLALLSSLAGREAGVHNFVFMFFVIPFMIFSDRENKYLYSALIPPLITWATLERFDYQLVATTTQVPDVQWYVTPFAFVVLSISVASFRKIISVGEVEIARQNSLLRNQKLELRRLNTYQDKIVESMNDGLIMADRDGLISKVNSATCRLLGYSSEELIGAPMEALLSSDRNSLRPNRSSFSNLLGHHERTLTTKDEQRIPVLISSAIVRGDGEREDAHVCILHDIRDRKRAEAYVETILQASPGGLIVLDDQWRIERVNDTLLEISGYVMREVVGRRIELLIPQLHEEATHGIGDGRNADSGGQGGGHARNVWTIRKDGSVFPAHVSFRQTTLQGRERILMAILDRTENARIEEDRLRMEQDIAYSSGMAEVSSGVLHNVGNVVNSVNIAAYSAKSILRKGSVPLLERAVKLLKEHNEEPESLHRFLVDDPRGKRIIEFLEAAVEKLRSEGLSVEKELDELGESIQHIISIVANQQEFASSIGMVHEVTLSNFLDNAIALSGIEGSRLELQIDRAYEDGLSLMVDKHKLTQIVVNLLRNARDALAGSDTPERSIRLSTHSSADGNVQISVSDNGVGISKENLARVFSHGFTTKPTGHGFGLHTSATAAQELGGALAVESEGLGHGASFIVTLPSRERKAA